MVTFPIKFAITLLLISIITSSNNQYKTECNYFNEPGFPSTTSLYEAFNPSTNYSYKVQSGTYAVNFCNFDSSQNQNNGGFSWKYQCCNPEENNSSHADLCIYIYEGTTNCDLATPSFETIILSSENLNMIMNVTIHQTILIVSTIRTMQTLNINHLKIRY